VAWCVVDAPPSSPPLPLLSPVCHARDIRPTSIPRSLMLDPSSLFTRWVTGPPWHAGCVVEPFLLLLLPLLSPVALPRSTISPRATPSTITHARAPASPPGCALHRVRVSWAKLLGASRACDSKPGAPPTIIIALPARSSLHRASPCSSTHMTPPRRRSATSGRRHHRRRHRPLDLGIPPFGSAGPPPHLVHVCAARLLVRHVRRSLAQVSRMRPHSEIHRSTLQRRSDPRLHRRKPLPACKLVHALPPPATDRGRPYAFVPSTATIIAFIPPASRLPPPRSRAQPPVHQQDSLVVASEPPPLASSTGPSHVNRLDILARSRRLRPPSAVSS